MEADFPEIALYTRIWRIEAPGGTFIFYKDKRLGGQQELFVENSFLKMFNYPLIAGDSKTALAEPYTIVITTSLAKKLFNVSDANMASGDRQNL